MLNFFPALYPDETWYSIICRYHIRTGNPNYSITIRDLFNEKEFVKIGTSVPNNTIYEVISKLPEKIYNTEEIILEHTLFKYLYRFHSLEEKYNTLENLKIGKGNIPVKLHSNQNFSKELKACPLCMREDKEKYGETYWHLCHQIPLIEICPKHKCELILYTPKSNRTLSSTLLLPENCIKIDKINYKPYHEILLNNLLDYQYMPLEIGPTKNHNNLYIELINQKYGEVRKGTYFIINKKKILNDLYKLYGKENIELYFPEERMKAYVMNSIRLWKIKSPERYALLSGLVNQPANITFKETPIENKLYQEFIKLNQEGKIVSQVYLAEKLGIKIDDVRKISYNLNSEIYGRDSKILPKKEKIVFSLSSENKKKIYEYTKTHGFTYYSNFIIHCIEKYIEENP